MALRYFTANRQADASSLEFVAAMQALEHLEDPIEIDFVEADAVVGEHELALRGGAVDAFGFDRHERSDVRFVELEAVAEEVLKQLAHLHRIGIDGRQRIP